MTVNEINDMDLTDFKDVDFNHIKSRTAYWNTMQMALKISINALYGALANVHFPLFNRDIAASITGNGRIFIQGLANYINKKLQDILKTDVNFVVYGDTDSVYFTLEELVKKLKTADNKGILQKLLNFDEKYIDKWTNEYIDLYADTFNAFNKDVIGAKLEKVADKGIFVAKKKYALRAIWDEGSILLDNPKMAVTGLEIVRSSTPMFCRTHLKKILTVILDNSERDVIDEIGKIKDLFYEATIEDISRVSGIGSMDFEGEIGRYTKINEKGKIQTAGMNVRAGMNYNLYIEQEGLTNFPQITVDDKIKYCFLIRQNPLRDDVIGYLDDKFLIESGLIKYIDRDRMWEDFFISPMNIMLEAIEYDLDRNFDMDEWL